MTHRVKIVKNSVVPQALLHYDKKYREKFPRAKQLLIQGFIDIRCNALGAVPERRAILKINAYFVLPKIKWIQIFQWQTNLLRMHPLYVTITVLS